MDEKVDGPKLNDEHEEEREEKFGELLKFTFGGFFGGIVLGAVLDYLGFQKSAVGQWLVRTLSGEGESIFEGVFALRRRLRKASESMAEAYGWGKLIGMMVPWIIDWGSRLAGVNVYGAEGFYIPYFYALSDQIGGNVSGFLYIRKRSRTRAEAARRYIRHPVMITGLSIILIVPVGLLSVRLLGFSPTTQVYTALETIAANLCWVPPLVGWLAERGEKKS